MSNTEKLGVSRIRNFLSCRQVLNLLTMFGFMLNYALRVNLTIAIVAMVQPENATAIAENLTAGNDTGNGTDYTSTTTTTT